jgi:rhodanese-related sulfurtransferase
MRTLLLILFFVIQTPKVEVLEKPEYQNMVAKGYTLIDVRTPEEFKEGHIEGALN